MLRHRAKSALAELVAAAAMQTKATHQDTVFAWGQTLLTKLRRVWAQFAIEGALAYEDKVAAQVRALEETIISLGQLSESLAPICRRLVRHQQALGADLASLRAFVAPKGRDGPPGVILLDFTGKLPPATMRTFLGRVSRYTPLRRVRQRRWRMFTHILVPLDGSEYAERALAPALSLAEKYGARLTLLTVMLQFPESRFQGPIVDQRSEEHGRRYLEDVRVIKIGAAAVSVNLVTKAGTPAEGIVECARESQADLIVMSTHGTTGTRYTLGSTAWKILQDAPCPVLLLPVPRPSGRDATRRGQGISA
jgi:nucleotide-binding universal stress UspA family protein